MSRPETWDREKAKKLWLDGKSGSQIAEIVGAPSRSAIIGYMNSHGVFRDSAKPRPPRVVTPRAAKPRTGRPAPTTDRPKGRIVFSWGKGEMGEAVAGDLETVAQAEAPGADPSSLKTLAERGRDECCWPIGAPDPVRGQLFCGRATPARKPYCPDHSPAQTRVLRSMRLKDEGVRRARPERCESDIDLVETFA